MGLWTINVDGSELPGPLHGVNHCFGFRLLAKTMRCQPKCPGQGEAWGKQRESSKLPPLSFVDRGVRG
jgi:hypothetical protein